MSDSAMTGKIAYRGADKTGKREQEQTEQNNETVPALSGEIIPPRKVGRPSGTVYNEEQAVTVLELISNGSNLDRIGTDPHNGLPGKNTLYKWRVEVLEFANGYARAREERADARADKIDSILDKCEAGTLLPNQARTLIDGHKWQAGKEKPSVYGDKAIIEGGDKPIMFSEMSELDAVNKLALLLSGVALEDS